jgi:hypothetical protein
MKVWLAALLLVMCGLARAEIFSFGLIGDVPYSDYERRELPHMLESMAAHNVAFIAHIGDIKHGGDRCDDSVFVDRYQLFDSSRVPFVFVPGDNEWTDCERQSNGAYQPLERLAKLRSLFWKDAYSLGQNKLKLEQQAGAYPEHARFRLGPVLFITLNIPGGNNFGLTDTPSQEFLARNPVVLEWMKDSFALARREKLAGIVLLFQADPAFKHFAQGFGHRAYRDFLETLRGETLNFPGQVVAVHGDSHVSRIDQPLRDTKGKAIANFIRVETFGYPIMGWTRGVIDTDSPTVFRFEAHPWPTRQ